MVLTYLQGISFENFMPFDRQNVERSSTAAAQI